MTSSCVQGGCPPLADDFAVVCVSLQLLRRKRRMHSNKTLKREHSPAWGLLPGAVFLRKQLFPG